MVALLLLEKGVDLNAKTHDSQTALHLAAEKGHEMVAQLLLEKGATVNAKTQRGQTALHLAAEKVHEMMVWLLTPLTLNS